LQRLAYIVRNSGLLIDDRTTSREPLFSSTLAQNIDALIERRRAEERQKSVQQRVSDAITGFAGSLPFVYVHAALFGSWIVWSLGLIPGLPEFDRGFAVLAVVAAVEAMFLSTFVLISQNSMQAQQAKRAELDLQISLLAEHEVTQVVHLLDAVARKLGVEDGRHPAIEEAKQHVQPEAVLEALDRQDSS
jgi:uncharacterized membrane protein